MHEIPFSIYVLAPRQFRAESHCSDARRRSLGDHVDISKQLSTFPLLRGKVEAVARAYENSTSSELIRITVARPLSSVLVQLSVVVGEI